MKVQSERLRSYICAERAILSGQSYELDGRRLTRADLGQVQSEIDRLLSGGVRMDGVERRLRMRRVLLMEG